MPGVPLDEVYRDQAIPTKHLNGLAISSSSQPAIMAIMLDQLDVQPGHGVLEIGAGTGYNAALMAHIVGDGGEVVTIDIDEDIVEAARAHLAAAGFPQVRVVCGDGAFGFPAAAPFDRIVLTVAAVDISPAWREQSKPDGRLLLPLRIGGILTQKSVLFEQADDHLASASVGVALLTRGTGTSQPIEAIDSTEPFELLVRSFDSADHLVQPLVEHVAAWDAAGRLSSEGLHVRAYPPDAAYVPSEMEIVIQKPWTRLVLNWRQRE